jgi:hypothetical protein
MANRFTDSRKWDDPWFRKLPCKHKAFWLFLLDRCNHAGIWKVDFESAEFHIGEKIDPIEIKTVLNGRIEEYGDKWFIPKFITFQYHNLNEDNRVHKSIIEMLKREGAYKGLASTLQGAKDKDKDKDIYIKGVVKGGFDEVWELYPNKVGKKEALRHFMSSVKTDEDLKNIKIAIENYKQSERVKKGYIQNGSTFFNDWQGWILQTPKPVDPLAKWENTKHGNRA